MTLPSNCITSGNFYNSNSKTICEIDLKEIFPFVFQNGNDILYEKISNNLENLKRIFEYYSSIGIKTDVYNIGLSGFLKFALDINIISKKEFDSPVKQYNKTSKKELAFTENQSEKNLIILQQVRRNSLNKLKGSGSFDSENQREFYNSNNTINQVNSLAGGNHNLDNLNIKKLLKSDVSLIFHYLSGMKNFDYSKKFKNQFDKNSGYNPEFENSQKGPFYDSKTIMQTDKDLKVMKINFPLFLKSFELFSTKIYKNLNPSEALETFFDTTMRNFLNKRDDNTFSNKNTYLLSLNNLRRNEIVIIFLLIFSLKL